MSKLIHSQSLATIKNKTPLLYDGQNYTQVAKSGIIFTDDGYMVVRGKEFKIALANATLSADVSNAGILTVTVNAKYWETGLNAGFMHDLKGGISGNQPNVWLVY